MLSDYREVQEVRVGDANRLMEEGWHLLSIAHCAKPRLNPETKTVYVSKYVRYVVGKYDPLIEIPAP